MDAKKVIEVLAGFDDTDGLMVWHMVDGEKVMSSVESKDDIDVYEHFIEVHVSKLDTVSIGYDELVSIEAA